MLRTGDGERKIITVQCANCIRWTKPRKNSACKMDQDNPNYIPVNDYIKNDDGSFYCLDFKVKQQAT